MRRSPNAKRLRRGYRAEGFALVIALSLMAFVLVLLLAMTALTRVESSAGAIRKEALHARQNALLGAMVALGELQKNAGPDRRATGTAALLDNDPESLETDGVPHPHWTGVWNPDEPENPLWLVSRTDSGTAPDPQAALAEGVEIVGANSTDEPVRVPNRAIGETGTDGFAWWVGDEGVKAKVNTTNPYLDPSASDEEKALSLQTAQRATVEAIDDETGTRIGDRFDPADANLREKFRRLRLLSGLPLTDRNLWTDALLRRRFHDLTTVSAGLLADSAEGGLRRDLNLAFEMGLGDFNADTTFAAGGERPFAEDRMSHDIRYVFDETNGQRVRGPTWHLLRNYYRLYKANDPDRNTKENHPGGIRDTEGDPVVRARPAYVGDEFDSPYGWSWDQFPDFLTTVVGPRGDKVLRRTAMQIAPVFTRRQLVFSVEADQVGVTADGEPEYKLIFHVDPVETLWNPYNVALQFSELQSGWTWMSLKADIMIDPPDAPAQTIRSNLERLGGVRQGNSNLMSLRTRLNASGEQDPDESDATVRMEPGELMVFSNIEGETTYEKFGNNFSRVLYLGPGLGDLNNHIQQSVGFSSDRLDSNNELDRDGKIIVPEDTNIEIRLEGRAGRSMITSMQLSGISGHNSMFARLFYDESSVERDTTFFVRQGSGSRRNLNPSPSSPRKTPVAALQIQLKAESATKPIPLLAQANPFATGLAPLTGGAGYPEASPDAFEIGMRKVTSWQTALVSIAADSPRGFWGPSHDASGKNFIPAVELPVAPLLSIASLQNAHVAKLPHHPAFAVAGSHASPYIPRDQVRHALETNRGTQTEIDYSYLMNEALFDRYFFSSLAPRPGAPDSPSLEDVLDDALADDGRLPNTRMRLLPGGDETKEDIREKLLKSDGSPTADAYRRIAENVLIEGGFNVNSTSVEAWKAVLAGTNGTDVQYRGGAEPDADSPLTRYRVPSGPPDQEWRGFNTLTPEQIEELAEKIVEEVKQRGPFRSLADFVNRRLATDETGLKGALQAAIDRSGINDGFSKGYRTEEQTSLGDADFIHPDALHGPVAAGAPAFLSQRDLLVPLGPTLVARSDTFRIRARGARKNPATGEETGEAWCELIVQRVPEKVDPAESIEDPDPPGGFGRRFEIVDFRWLAPDEV